LIAPILFVTLAGSTLLGGCKSRREAAFDKAAAAIKDGSAKAALQHYFDGHRQCGRVFDANRNIKLMETAADNPIAPALVQAGLIVPVSGAETDEANAGMRLYKPSPSAARWYGTPPTERGEPYSLCYAHREIRAVWLDPNVIIPALRYSYALVDPAPWAASGPVRKAVPTLAGALSQVEIYNQDGFIPFKDGKPQFDSMQKTEDDPTLFQFGVNFEGLGIPAAN
jgi:hypothetical protein